MSLEEALVVIAALETEKGKLIAKRDELLTETKSKGDRLAELTAKVESVKKFEGVDVEGLIKFKEETEKKKLEDEGNYAELMKRDREKIEREKAEWASQYTEKEKSLQAQIDQERLEREKYASELLTVKLDNRVLDAFSKAGVIAPMQLLSLTKTNLKLSDAGDPVYQDGYNQIPLKDYVEGLKKNEEYQHHFRASGSRGGGTPPGSGGSGGSTGNNPFAKETFNLTAQGELYKTNPAEFNRLKAEAAR
jgi:hypothetical protein